MMRCLLFFMVVFPCFCFAFEPHEPLSEHDITITVTSLSDSGQGSLREALEQFPFPSSRGEQSALIQFAPGLSGAINLASPLPEANIMHLTIVGPGADNLTIQHAPNWSSPNDSLLYAGSGYFSISDVTFRRPGYVGSIPEYGGLVSVESAYSAVFDRVRFEGGRTSQLGGCLMFYTHQLVVRDSLFTDCRAGSGGAIWGTSNWASHEFFAYISGTRFENNHAAFVGAVSLDVTYNIPSQTGRIFLHDSEFVGNSSELGGGGTFRVASETISGAITNTTFLENSGHCSAIGGYARYLDHEDGGLSIDGITVSGNHSPTSYQSDYLSAHVCISAYDGGPLSISNSRILGNTGFDFDESPFFAPSRIAYNPIGALWISGTESIHIQNSIFHDNDAGIFIESPDADIAFRNSSVTNSLFSGLKVRASNRIEISNSTFFANRFLIRSAPHPFERMALILRSTEGASVSHSTITGNYGGLFSDNLSTIVSHSILTDNSLYKGPITGDAPYYDFLGRTESRFNIVGVSFDVFDEEGSGIIDIDDSTIFSSTPRLGPLANNGGMTLTLLPQDESPAFNAGDPAFSGPPMYDQRGPGYPRVQGGRINIGAVEGSIGSMDRIFHSRFSN